MDNYDIVKRSSTRNGKTLFKFLTLFGKGNLRAIIKKHNLPTRRASLNVEQCQLVGASR